jgi:hypothetical protein
LLIRRSNHSPCGAARNILINAQPKFPREAIIYYDLGMQSAKKYLKQLLEIDLSWRLQALEGDDLKPL